MERKKEELSELFEKVNEVQKILEDSPEVNIHNFDIDDVEKLNSSMISAYNELDQLIKDIKDWKTEYKS